MKHAKMILRKTLRLPESAFGLAEGSILLAESDLIPKDVRRWNKLPVSAGEFVIGNVETPELLHRARQAFT
ncbi:MAG TPA: hypothetical protein VGJ51_12075 [Candidatus Angelobacter sp.]